MTLVINPTHYCTFIVMDRGQNVAEFSTCAAAQEFVAEPRRFGYFGLRRADGRLI